MILNKLNSKNIAQGYHSYYKRGRLEKLLYILTLPIVLISIIFPKQKGLVLFGSMNGYAVTDNSKYLFINTYNSNMFYITKNKDILNQNIMPHSYPVYSLSLLGIWLQLRAETIYYTHSIFDFTPSLIWGAKKIALWHGVPIKNIGPASDWANTSPLGFKLRLYFYRLFPFLYYMSCDFILCPFVDQADNYNRYFIVSRPQLIFKKQPRNIYAPNASKVNKILYAPTHRKQLNDSDFSTLISKVGLFDTAFLHFLDKYQLSLVLRPHPVDTNAIKSIALPNNVELDESTDLYQSIKSYVAVVTDYSSIYYDCMEIGIPCIFVAPDILEYDEKVGLDNSFIHFIKSNSCSEIKHSIPLLQEIINAKYT